MDHPRPWLQYVSTGDLERTPFDGAEVDSPAGDKLGSIDGFIIDTEFNRPQYVVIDSGGWFKSKHFLLPVGHARFDAARRVLVADLTRERIHRYPGFDKDEFESLSDDQIRQLHLDTAAACCPTDPNAHFGAPDWWKSDYYKPNREMRGVTGGVSEQAIAHDKHEY